MSAIYVVDIFQVLECKQFYDPCPSLLFYKYYIHLHVDFTYYSGEYSNEGCRVEPLCQVHVQARLVSTIPRHPIITLSFSLEYHCHKSPEGFYVHLTITSLTRT